MIQHITSKHCKKGRQSILDKNLGEEKKTNTTKNINIHRQKTETYGKSFYYPLCKKTSAQ